MLERIRKTAGMLRAEAGALSANWATGNVDQAERYHELRTQSWTGLSEVRALLKGTSRLTRSRLNLSCRVGVAGDLPAS